MLSRPDLGVPPILGYTASALDRAADRRHDEAAIAACEGDPRARIHLIAGELVVAHKPRGPRDGGEDPAFTFEEAAALAAWQEKMFLGLQNGAPRFAASIDEAAVEALRRRSDLLVMDLRSIATGGLLAPEYLPPLAEAKAVLGWHARHRFCANCGTPSRAVDAGWRRDCQACGVQHFPRTDPVVIMLAIDGERCLLGRSPRFAPRMWSCLAGFVEPGETLEEAVRRETREEAGIACGRVAYFASQPWPFPMSLMIGCYAAAISTDITVDRSELEDARWFSREEIVAMLLRRHPEGLTVAHPIAIAHHIIRAWVEADRSPL
ncbi:MAG: NAD(+) diphosphatase [Xanthobacteraceae bacterium]|nr:NAD(+) diphosphatase [Xanthobacteraceae bacterium]